MSRSDTGEVIVETTLVDDLLDEGRLERSRGSLNDEPAPVRGSPSAEVGVLVGFLESGEPLVDFPGSPSNEPLPARSTLSLDKGHLGRSVVLLFEGADRRKPIVSGLLHESQQPAPPSTGHPPAAQRNHVELEADGDRFVITAEREIVLRCGEASITLTRAGKVMIRGTYVVSRSSGMNRIQGGAVHIN